MHNCLQTCVAHNHYTESTIVNSAMGFIDYTEGAAGVSLYHGKVATDINLWCD